MSKEQISAVILALTVIVAAAHLLGAVFVRLRQPKLVGEILAGILVGPWVLGQFAPDASQALLGNTASGESTALTLGFVHSLGLMFLMFISGSEARRVLAKENHKPTAWILGIGTPLPFFLAIGLGLVLPLEKIAGSAGLESDGWPVRLVLAAVVAVTSIPVISRIFFDLKILHTRFASLILGAALLEDIVLWGVLAIATALGKHSVVENELASHIAPHVAATLGFMAFALFAAPSLLRKLHDAPWNVIRKTSPTGYATLILLVYASIASAIGVELTFAAFLAGFGLVGGMSGSQRARFLEPLDAIQKVAMGVFIPSYFALVGTKLVFGHEFSIGIFVSFLLGSSLLCFISVGLAARMAGFRGLEIVNLTVACNARGGPGIVFASVAYANNLINGSFFTTLVITAVVTSQFAGAWLGLVLRRGWTLLRDDMPDLAPGSPAADAMAPGTTANNR